MLSEWNGFIGQEALINRFTELYQSGSMAHAYALCGPDGIGKLTLARAFAKMLLCTGEAANPPCGVCRSCRSFEMDSNPNYMQISASTQKIGIEQIRALIDDIATKPAFGRKVYVIEDGERMTPAAQNCLLKTLEEPPSYGVIFITTALYSSLLSTVRSRLVHLTLTPYKEEELKEVVKRGGISFQGREYALAYSGGIPGKAVEFLADGGFEETRRQVMDFVFATESIAASMAEFNLYLSKNKQACNQALDILMSVYRDAMLLLCGEEIRLINPDKKGKLLEYIKKHDRIELANYIDRLEIMRNNLKHNLNYQLAVDMVTLIS